MALSEVLVATEVAAKTATVVGEGIKEAVNVTEIAETSKAVLNLTEAQANYLSELNIPNNTWKAMSSEVQGHHIQLIDTRMKEMGLEPSARSLEGIFDSKLVESLESEHIIKHPELLQKEGLTVEEKEALKLETGWSDRIVDYIGSMEEAEIYKDAGLVEMEVNGKASLVQPKLEWDTPVGPNGETNAKLLARGPKDITWGPNDRWYSPRWNDGTQMELHHIGQHPDSPFAELTMQQHRGLGNDTILHNKLKESEIDRAAFQKERSQHWISRFLNRNL